MSDVRIADLKARLSEHLRSVRNGGTLTVLDRDTPVARIVPYAAQPLEMRKAKRHVRHRNSNFSAAPLQNPQPCCCRAELVHSTEFIP